MIKFQLADYGAPDHKQQILSLYQDIFHVDFAEDYDTWFCGPCFPLGVIALNDNSGKIVGHFASLRFEMKTGTKIVPFRMSMGFMVSPECRGMGIGSNLYKYLRTAISEKQDSLFMIGFPNEVSYKMHIDRMEYILHRNYHFVVLPKGEHQQTYSKIHKVPKQLFVTSQFNCILHSESYMCWRYENAKYDKWMTDNGHIFISTKFKDKADILYWSEDVCEDELLDFAAFLYQTQAVARVTTWNSTDYLASYPAEDRNYHMCMNYLDCDPDTKAMLNGNWLFYMGDCELF